MQKFGSLNPSFLPPISSGCVSSLSFSLPLSLPLSLSPPLPRMSGPLIGNSSGSESNLENAMQLMIQTFHKYSGNEGDKYTLSRGELKDMLTQELGNYLGNPQDKDAVDKVMGDLDANNDGEVDFTEFVILVGALTVACNDFFLEYNQKIEKKQ
ncbi:S100 calcium binding protein T isoform X1 [Conger conger]|uniref:S100 calcium binding protein T isoform X1 n=1 Tax=Conger conger TaxID=82655 RepID=UPI002A5A5E73|nr:S100 calcium binding protein T isoform X1 [Conger conger]